ncbi:MAG: Xaa-Pro peptidase family protein [Eubacteriales bacterium]|nr:Xaa-Pro peptidase family protein [Eubacteriales bacterium]
MKQRIEALRKNLAASSLDAALITSGVNIRYYSGFTSSDGILLVTQQNAYLVTDSRYTLQAKAQTKGLCEVTEVDFSDQLNHIRGILQQDGCKRAAFEDAVMTVSRFRIYEAMPVEWVAFSAEISLPRLHKSADEVENLQAAQRIADKSFLEWLGRIVPGMSEMELAAELNYVCAKNGSEAPSFDPIIAGGPNGAMPHAVPGTRKIQKGDLVTADFGCMVNGYHSDMTRTFAIGQVDDFSKEIYEIVKAAQQKTLDALKSGITGMALDAVARNYIAEKGHGAHFGHGLGHGVGLEIHESPFARRDSKDTLLSGMTITVEPGIYVEGKCGVRIEDCCVVTDTGYLNLTSVTKELITI